MVHAGDITLPELIGRFLPAPLARALLLSLSLHLAIILIVQPRAFLPPIGSPPISATLLAAAPTPSLPLDPVAASALAPLPETRPQRSTHSPEMAPEAAAARAEGAVEPPPATPREAGSALPEIPVMVDATWYTARELDSSPKALDPIRPLYPPEAIAQGIEGTVKLRLKVDEFGSVREAEVAEADPPGVFEASALDAFAAARFAPATKDGRVVRALIHIRVSFRLD